MNTRSLETIIDELRIANTSADVMLDNVDTLNSLKLLTIDMIRRFDMLIESNLDLGEILQGNRLQEREDRGELINVLDKLATNNQNQQVVPPPLPKSEEGGLGIFGKLAALFAIGGPIQGGFLAGIVRMFASMGKMISSLKGSGIAKAFTAIGSVIAKILPAGLMSGLSKIPKIFSIFGKLAKFAGPLGLVITVVTGLVGTVMGAIKGYKEDGIKGAIQEGLIGLFDSVFASTMQVLADMGGWILKLFGLEKLGSLLGPTVKQVIDQVLDNFRSLFTIFDAIISLDADKLADELSKYFTNGWENIIKPLGNLLLTGIMEIFPLIIKALKFLWIDLPIFIAKLGWQIIKYLFTEGPGIIKKIGVFMFDLINKIFTEVLPNIFWTVFNDIAELFSGASESIAGMFGDISKTIDKFQKQILRAILPDPTVKREWYDPIGMIQGVIPDAVYKYAYDGKTPAEFIADKTKTAKASGDFSALSNDEKGKAAGYNSWKEYEDSGYQWKENMQSVPSNSGAALNAAGASVSSNPTVVVNNNNGGNVSNVRSSNVNNNAPAMSPIMSASGMAFSY